VTRAALLESIWGHDPTMSRGNLDAFISLLRKKVDLPSEKPLVHTLKGVGYILRVDEPSLYHSNSETVL
jgi:DNA-binding response OmpR family regulator